MTFTINLLCVDNNEITKTNIHIHDWCVKTCIDEVFKQFPKIQTIEDRIWDSIGPVITIRVSQIDLSKDNVRLGDFSYNPLKYVGVNSISSDVPFLNYYTRDLKHTSITSLSHCFADCTCKIVVIDRWDVSNITDTSYMFKNTNNLNYILLNSNTRSLQNMEGMFYNCYCKYIEGFRFLITTNVTNMSYLFCKCWYMKHLDEIDCWHTENISSWNTRKLFIMSNMFSNCCNLKKLSLEHWRPKLVRIHGAFSGCISLKELDLSNLDFTNIRNIGSVFADCINLKTIKLPYIHKIGCMRGFANCRAIM